MSAFSVWTNPASNGDMNARSGTLQASPQSVLAEPISTALQSSVDPLPPTRSSSVCVRFTILGEPASKANSRRMVARFSKKNNRAFVASIKSVKALSYVRAAILQIPAHARLMLTESVRVTLFIFYATRRPDLDESVILDVLQAEIKNGVCLRRGVYVNDRQVKEKHIFHGLDKVNPRAEIEVEAMGCAS